MDIYKGKRIVFLFNWEGEVVKLYWTKNIEKELLLLAQHFKINEKSIYKLVLVSIFSSMAALFQAAGELIPVMGLIISPFSTLPIVICMLIGLSYGLMSYVLTGCLLLFIQPSELLIFLFTTGLVAVGIGVGVFLFKNRLHIIGLSALFLFSGILILLYGFRFPVLGPFALTWSYSNIVYIYIFSLIYCWLWLEFTVYFTKRLTKILVNKK